MPVIKILEYKLKGERNISSRIPLIIGDRLYVAFNFDKKGFVAGKVMCLDKNNFSIFWEYDYPFIINNLLLKNKNSLLVCCMDGKLIDLNTNNGSVISAYNLEIDRCGQSSSIVENHIVVGGVQRTTLTNCFDLTTKSLKWSYNNGGHSFAPLIKNDRVIQCTENKIRSLDLNSGKLIWEAKEKNAYFFNPISIHEMIVVGGYGFIYIYDFNNGKLLHKIKTGIEKSIRSIIAENDKLYFGESSGLFYAYEITQKKNLFGRLKLNSKKLWHYKSNGSIESIPAINGNSVLFINDYNKLICLDKKNGSENWKFNTKGEAGISGIAIDGEDIYVSVSKGYIYKLNEK
ncbi:PQQ-binding-like beta-propeller repeat protein [Ascidiimonas sp. W6]|uniref:outer membrane protein assembly factor BamB family protein n=1 Tax=Ascidiimonas meishanensis TaxID=3128903 RepID=UPI0030ED54F3